MVKPNAKIQNPEITGHHVKGQIALKFAPQTAVTKLIDVTWTVGQSNRMTPVAIFEPVVLGGATLQKASLGSYAKLKELDLHENDTIVVARANDVIPQVVSVQADERQPNAKAYDLPNDTYLDGGIVRSKTIDIPLAEKISRFASEVKIESAKTQTFQKLIDAGLMKSLKDLYLLKYEELIKLKGFGEQSVTTLLDEIEHSKQASFQQILKGLNYSGLGAVACQQFVTIWPDITTFLNADESSIESFAKCKGVSTPAVDRVKQLKDDPSELVEILQTMGVHY